MADFDKALAFVLRNEDATLSGKVTVDSGGRTRFGIAERFHPDLPAEFFISPAEQALAYAKEIYRLSYWHPISGESLDSDAVAAKVLDMAVNMGLHQGIVLLQRALGHISFPLREDGALGEHTLEATNEADPETLISVLCEVCTGFYQHIAAVRPEAEQYLHGWLARAKSVPDFTQEVVS